MDIWYRAARVQTLALGHTGKVRGCTGGKRGGGPTRRRSEEGAALCEGQRAEESSTAAPARAGLRAGLGLGTTTARGAGGATNTTV